MSAGGGERDTRALILAAADASLAARIRGDRGFPCGPAARSVIVTHMEVEGYEPGHVRQASDALDAAGIA